MGCPATTVERDCSRPGSHVFVSSAGLSLIELLLALAVFGVVLTATLTVLVSSLRVQRVAEAQSERIQETEAVVHLINYEVGLAGYTRTQAPQSFSNPDGPTIAVVRGDGSDRIRVRFFEDPDFLPTGDSGERLVEYRVDGGTLVREDILNDAVDELVGGVRSMLIVAFIGREREVLTEAQVESGDSEIAGVRVTVRYVDESEWTFLVGLYNRQRVSITGSPG